VTETVLRLNPATGEDSENFSTFLDGYVHIKKTNYTEDMAEMWWKEEYKASNVAGNEGIGAHKDISTNQPFFHRYWGKRRARNRTDYILTGDLCPILMDVVNSHGTLKAKGVRVSSALSVVRVEAPEGASGDYDNSMVIDSGDESDESR